MENSGEEGMGTAAAVKFGGEGGISGRICHPGVDVGNYLDGD